MAEVLRLEYVDGVMHFKTQTDDAVELVEGDEYCSAADIQPLRARIADMEKYLKNSARLLGERLADNAILAAENQRLQADRDRLDWLESRSSYQHVVEITHMRDDRSKVSVEVVCQLKREVEVRGWEKNLRSAIDAARGGK